MPVQAERLSAVLDRVYQAATEPEVWPTAIEEIGSLLDSSLGSVMVLERESGSFPFIAASASAPLEVLSEYTEHYGSIDDLRLFIGSRAEGAITTTESLPAELLRDSTCFNQFYRRWHLDRFMGTFFLRDERREASLVLYRGDRRAEPFSTEEVAAFGLVIPHLRRAVTITLSLLESGAAVASLSDALDKVPHGIVMLDSRGRIMRTNRAAAVILDGNDGIRATREGLRFDDPAANTAFARSLAGCRSLLDSAAPRGPILVRRPSRRAPYRVLLAPLVSRSIPGAPPGATILVTIADPARGAGVAANHLRLAYGLTSTEAELAAALAAGKTVREFGAERHVAESTVRSHLKQIMQKTDTHRQAELVRLILTEMPDDGDGE